MTIAAQIGERLTYPGRRRRRIWIGADRIHVEVRGLMGPLGPQVAAEVERSLQDMEGVEWAALDAVRERAVAQLIPGKATPEQAVAAIEKVEAAWGVSEERFPVDRAEHPEDSEPVTRHLLALGADVAGLGLGIFGKLLQATPLPIEAASVVTMVDNEPRIRHLLESHLGTPATDLGLAVTNAVGQGLAQGPLGVITDGAHRVNLLLEAQARRQAFERAEERRWGDGVPARSAVAVSLTHAGRPVRLPSGAVERHADRSALAGMAAAGVAVATTRRPRRGAAMLLAALPKAARLGREAFASHLGRDLAARDLLVLDTGALRRLDRVDTVVVDASLLLTGRSEIDRLERIGDADPREIHRWLSELFDPRDPATPRRRDGWWLGPPDAATGRDPVARRALRRAGPGQVLLLRDPTRTVAVATLQTQLSALGAHLVHAAHRQEHMVVVAGADRLLCDRVGADLVVEGGDGLARSVRQLQEDGCVVALVAPGGTVAVPALRAADVGVELPSLDGAAWSGDILINEARDAAMVLDAIGSAREVSRQSVAFSVAGSGIGALLAVTGPPARAASRASGAVNSAALVAMLNGIRAARYLARHGAQVPAEQVRWHELGAAEALDRLGSTPRGLPAAEAQRREADPIRLQPVRPSLLRSTAKELASPLTPILAGGAAASAAVGSMGDAAIVSAVSALNAVIGGVQRYSSEKAILSLGAVSATTVTVLRDGAPVSLPDRRLVPGDVILLQSGDVVPADCRVLSAQRLEVDESTVSGESDTVAKDPAPVFSSALSERSSMLYEGTTVAAGETTALVVAVGADTVASAMAAEVATAALPAGVEARLRHLTALTLPVAAAGGASIIGLGVLRGRSLQQSAGSAVALAVAAVPEGLPVLATMAQLAAARRLSEHDVLVRDPRAIEALGRVQVLCTDKTGTLTEGRIRLRRVSNGAATVDLDRLAEPYAAIVAAGVRASPESDPDRALPHLTDRAVVDGARRCGIDGTSGCPGWEHRAEQPFEPARGYHAVLGSTGAGGLLSVKGAPETVLPRCCTWRSPAGDVPIDARSRRRLERHMEALARQGLRVLAVAEATVDSIPDELTEDEIHGLVLLGFLGLSDPVRSSSAAAVSGLRRAGVTVMMVTGDHPSTAEHIAVELGILDGRRVITGPQLAAMADPDLDAVIADVSVFARVTPKDKVRIVAALQRRGTPVAMTGDGANDAPAIRLANVGIAVGSQATAAARGAADLVVVNERIETIVDAIIEGRAMWASLRDALALLLGGNLGEVVFTVAATAVSGRAPLNARQLLAVNLLTDIAPALAIAMRQPPDRPPEALLAEGPDASLGRSLERDILLRAATTALGAGLAWSVARMTGRRERASTTALVALVATQLGQTVVSGGLDPLVLLAGGGSAAIMAGIVQTPGLSGYFGCTPLGPVAWATALGSAGVAVGVSVAGGLIVQRLVEPTSPELLGGVGERFGERGVGQAALDDVADL